MSIEQELAGVVPADLDLSPQVQNQPLPEKAKTSSSGILALLSSNADDLERVFSMALTDFDNGSTATMDQVKGEVVTESVKASRDMLVSQLADPNIDLETKKGIISILNRQETEWQNDSANLLTEKLLVEPSSPVETVDLEIKRTALAERLRPIHEMRKERVSMRNSIAKENENDTRFTKADEFLEFLLPYATNAEAADTLTRVKESLGKPGQSIRNFLLPGNAKQAIRDAIANAPASVMKGKQKELVDEIKRDSGLIVRNDSNTAELVLFDQLFNDYSGFEKFIDNTVGILDSSFFLAPVASLIGKPIQKAMQVARMERVLRNIERASVVDRIDERTAASVARAANPDKARIYHQVVVTSESDMVAQAVYGATREEAIISDLAPQVGTVDGTVAARVPDIEKKTITVDADIAELANNTSSYRYSDAEYQSAISHIVHDFHNADGLHVNPQMGQVTYKPDGGRVTVSGVYGNTEGGFLDAELAMEKAVQAFRHRGILPEEITLLKNNGLEYEPVKLSEVKGVQGDYLVKIEMDVPVMLDKAEDFQPMSVKYNIFDRIPVFQFGKSGSLQRWFTDAGSMFEKHISGAASVAIDRAASLDKALLGQFTEFAERARALPKDRQQKLMKHIQEANAKGLELTDPQLVAEGFKQAEIDALKKWRRANDTMFYLENSDLVKTLNHQGYKLLDDGVDRFFAKEVANRGLDGSAVYDPVSKTLVRMAQNEINQLYANGGTVGRLRRPVTIGNQTIDYIRVDNNATHYLRSLRETDQVLNYRKGYYQVQYDAPLFLVKKVDNGQGGFYEQRVAVAGSTKEAELARRSRALQEGKTQDEWGYIAEDKRGLRQDSDAYWDLQSASGRIAQRHRGKRLEGLTGTNMVGADTKYIVDPIEASIQAARSLSARVATRDTLETIKSRAMVQYRDFFPSDGMGGVRWPSNATEIVSKSKTTTKDIADARTTWEYVNYLEYGYMNTMDEAFKWAMNSMANTMGKLGMTSAEKAAYALQELAPSQFGKELVYHAYIGTNPIRQIIVQPHQAVRMMAYNPQGMIKSIEMALGFVNSKLYPSFSFSKEQVAFNKSLNDSGLMAAVDKQNLVRGSLINMVESSNRYKRIAAKTLAAPRVIGFDIGERTNIVLHYANVWDKKKRQGFDVFNKRVQEEIHSEARALSYEMNLAGDMPYNQNFAAILMQFAQVPHKALLQTLNRRIAPKDRVKLAIFDATMWGVPLYGLSEWVGKDMVPEDPELRAIATQGLEQFIFNQAITYTLGKEANLDIRSSFSPYDWGWAEVAHAILVDKSLSDALTNSPSGKLFFGDNSRLGEAFRTLGQFLHMKESYGTEVGAWDVVTDFLRISSGFKGMSDAYRAAYVRESAAAMNKEGVILDPNRSNFEVLMGIAGFQNKSVADMYEMSEKLYKDNKRFREEVMQTYKEVKRTLFSKTQAPLDELKHMARVLGEMERVYSHNPEVAKMVMSQLEKDAIGKDKWILQTALRAAGRGEMALPTLMKRIEDSPAYTEEDKNAVRTLLKDAEEAQKYFEGLE